MQTIVPFLWFESSAQEAAKFYVSVFQGGRILSVARYGPEGPGRKGSVMTVSFRLRGEEFVALNGGPVFKINPAISFVVKCRTQAEIDYYWKKLSAGGRTLQCGWLEDKFGVSWQIVPSILPELVSGGGPEQSSRVMSALLQMEKLDVAKLKAAAKRPAANRKAKRK